MIYSEYLKSKEFVSKSYGFDINESIVHEKLYDFQRAIVAWAIKKGKACIFADCGLGKTFMQLEWGRLAGGKCLILAPLAVSKQTANEGKKIGITVNLCESQDDVKDGLNITNYEKLHKFDCSVFDSVILDESSILKSFDGKYRNMIIESFKNTKYKLACTATPSPNDYMELGNHSEFLGVMSRTEMLATFFVHDGGDTSQWRLKGHAVTEFWRWVCSWSVYLRNPAELGYDGKKFVLPKLNIHRHILRLDKPTEGYLIPMEASSLSERRDARRSSLDDRVLEATKWINGGQTLIWCNMNAEGDALEKAIEESVQVAGADTDEHKENSIDWFVGNKCLCLECFSDKLSTWIKNTSNDTTKNTEKRKLPKLENGKLKMLNTDETIYENGSSLTVRKSKIIEEKQRTGEMPPEESNTHQTQRCESNTKNKQKNGRQKTLEKDLTKECEDMGLRQANTKDYLKSNAANVPFAKSLIAETVEVDDSMLTTAMQQNESGVYSAQTAILELENSTMTQSDLNRLPCICGQGSNKKTLITKPRIFGWGLNMQSCHNMIFVGLSDSFEQYYQAVRRCWRFGQKKPVDVHIILSEAETAILKNIERKQEDYDRMAEEMSKNTKDILSGELHQTKREHEKYKTDIEMILPSWVKSI